MIPNNKHTVIASEGQVSSDLKFLYGRNLSPLNSMCSLRIDWRIFEQPDQDDAYKESWGAARITRHTD